MTRPLAALLALAVLVAAGPAAAQTRAAVGWIAELDGCLAFMRTGRDAFFRTGASTAFPGWYLAHPEGGVCNGPPDPCLGEAVTVIARHGNGAATLREADARHGGRLTCAHTPNPPHHRFETHATRTRAWLERQEAAERLIRVEGADAELSGRWAACEGAEAPLELSLRLEPGTSPSFVFAAPSDAGLCNMVTS